MLELEKHPLLLGRLPSIPQVVSAPSLRHDMDELVSGIMPAGRVALVDDVDTSAALGDAVHRAIRHRYEVVRIDCGKMPRADMKLVEALRTKSKKCDLLIAVGSGTVSDLCKYASHLDGKPYVIFPTAASMNGYLSATASLSDQGYKQSFPAHLPLGVFCDLGVIAAAPSRLSKSGLGDSVARATAQTDWLLSHLLVGTPYDDTPFRLVAEHEPAMLESARGIALRDAVSIRQLMQVLLLSGIGMTLAGGSYPASQAEHMLAHTYEMLRPDAPPTLHGEQIGVTTLMAAHMQHALLEHAPALRRDVFPLDAITRHFGPRTAKDAAKAYLAKQERINQSGLTGRGIREKWPDIAQKLAPVMMPPARIQEVLQQAQAPHRLEMLGWPERDFAIAVTHAHFMRDRFTCLDVIPG